MFKIIEKRALADNIYLLRIEAPRVAQSALPGQFVIVRVDEQGERAVVSESKAPVGSSASIISGLLIKALAIATLCFCPPDT